MTNPAVQIRSLDKKFTVERTRPTMFRFLKRALLRRQETSGTFFALRDIRLEVMKGETIGVVGNNGSGKTTLLKVMAGLYAPDRGSVTIQGDMVFLAGLGTGMLDDLSVEKNVYLYGTIYGMERKMIRDRIREIIEWAELQDFVGAKLKTLSSGMRTRLAFSAMRHIDTDIYLMDEALSAGDKIFKQKCHDFFRSQQNSRKTFIIATHDTIFVSQFCAKTLWLHKGKLVMFGETASVLKGYMDSKSG